MPLLWDWSLSATEHFVVLSGQIWGEASVVPLAMWSIKESKLRMATFIQQTSFELIPHKGIFNRQHVSASWEYYKQDLAPGGGGEHRVWILGRGGSKKSCSPTKSKGQWSIHYVQMYMCVYTCITPYCKEEQTKFWDGRGGSKPIYGGCFPCPSPWNKPCKRSNALATIRNFSKVCLAKDKTAFGHWLRWPEATVTWVLWPTHYHSWRHRNLVSFIVLALTEVVFTLWGWRKDHRWEYVWHEKIAAYAVSMDDEAHISALRNLGANTAFHSWWSQTQVRESKFVEAIAGHWPPWHHRGKSNVNICVYGNVVLRERRGAELNDTMTLKCIWSSNFKTFAWYSVRFLIMWEVSVVKTVH